MTHSASPDLPVVVIGAGPVGLAAAAHLVERGLEPLVIEAGPWAGAAVREWAHVRLFSPWSELTDPAAERLLAPTGWTKPDPATYPTGGDWAGLYLQPLADALGHRVRYGSRVTGVSRAGRDRVVDADRATQPFNGLPALGETAAADRIAYRVPDLADARVRGRYAGKRTAVIGSGTSAFTALASLADLAKADDGHGSHTVWVLRRGVSGSTFGGGSADQLPARGALGLAAKAAVDDGHADAVTGFRTEAIETDAAGRVILVGEDGRRLDPVDEVLVLTGLRPDLSFLDELRLALDERLQAPVGLAPLIDPNQHSPTPRRASTSSVASPTAARPRSWPSPVTNRPAPSPPPPSPPPSPATSTPPTASNSPCPRQASAAAPDSSTMPTPRTAADAAPGPAARPTRRRRDGRPSADGGAGRRLLRLVTATQRGGAGAGVGLLEF